MATVYAIQRDEEGMYVDRGGRSTRSIPQVFFWNKEEKAQAFLDKGREKIYVGMDDDLSKFKVVPVEVTFG